MPDWTDGLSPVTAFAWATGVVLGLCGLAVASLALAVRRTVRRDRGEARQAAAIASAVRRRARRADDGCPAAGE